MVAPVLLIWGDFRMRKLLLIASLFITSSYAYQMVNQEKITEQSLALQEKQDARLPVTSLAKPGKVIRHKVDLVNFTYAVFIIGDDAFSHQWLKDHATELECINAFGFVTNISDNINLQKLQQLTKAPLLPSNVDDLMDIFKESQYPLIFHKGEIWQ